MDHWGTLNHLTDEQQEVLNSLRQRVDEELPAKDYLSEDSSLLRYCRARNFNLEKTFNMIKEDVSWREPYENYKFQRTRDFGGAYSLHERGCVRLAGRSKEGKPVLMVEVRQYDPSLVDSTEKIRMFFAFYVDSVCKLAEEAGFETFIGIADFEGFSIMNNFSFSQVKEAVSILLNHYPERLVSRTER